MNNNISQPLEKEHKMPWPAYAEIFEFKDEPGNEKNWAFLCKICIGKKIIHASRTSTSNLRKHIKAKHPHLLVKINDTKAKLKRRMNDEASQNEMIPNKCQILERWSSRSPIITQKGFDKAILRFILEDIQPLSIVDSPAFINLLRIGIPSNIRIMCRKTLREKICETYVKMKAALENKLTKLELVATTADLWSKAKRSYLGITVHWVNPVTLERESAALACRRMKGKHTYDILAQEINSIFLEYHFQNKICYTTTDNGSNFIKAFQSFKREEDETSSIIEFHDINSLLIRDNVEDLDAKNLFTLPPHHRCVSHTLNLITVKDSEKALDSDALYKKLYRLTFAKVTKLWNKQNQSTQVADKIKEICGIYLKTPVITRWNSTFDSMLQLATINKDPEKINQCLDYCNLSRLTENEIKFIEEYCQVMKPLAQALDILQSESGMYMGYLLPVLTTLEEKFKKFNTSGLMYCQPLIIAIQQGLNKRFSTLFEKKELIIASSLHPKFKLNWINKKEKRKIAQNYLEDLLGICSNGNSSNHNESADNPEDFFSFKQTKEAESTQEELHRFLKSKNCNIDLLHDFKKIKKLFITYNTALPSSASVERMFSVGGSVMTPQRGHLHDDIIEYQVLLKINKNIY